jgi:aminoglycoside phosphotransferase (APT) family kinase protein
VGDGAGMTGAPALPDSVAAAVAAFAAGRPVTEITTMPGHAGFSYGVVVDGAPFVLRVPPDGARHEGPADVLRQARVLTLLHRSGVPVPAVRGTGGEPAPWMAVDRLPGHTLRPTDDGPPRFAPAEVRPLALAAVDALAALHAVAPPDWLGETRDPAAAVTRWDRFAARADDASLLAGADALRGRLLATAPRAPATGIVHGDYQWGNLLGTVAGGEPRLLAVIDWELAHVGSVLDDLGWLCLFSDAAWWTGDAMTVPAGVPATDELCARYGVAEDAVRWHLALAAYAFAVVIALNLTLHRRGKRVDPYWELLAPSAPGLVRRALDLDL